MFESNFTHQSSTPLPTPLDLAAALTLLHDFETIVKLSPDCRACKPIPAPATLAPAPGSPPPPAPATATHFYEVEDDLPFIPKRLWAGGVRYTATFRPTPDGCDITVHAPGGFVSTNRWRVLRQVVPEDRAAALEPLGLEVMPSGGGARETVGGCHVQITSDARCPMAFATFVKGFLRNSQKQLQLAFIEKVKSLEGGEGQRKRRPTIGRRRSSEL